MTTNWGLPLAIGLMLLGLVYASPYLPATVHRAPIDQVAANQARVAKH